MSSRHYDVFRNIPIFIAKRTLGSRLFRLHWRHRDVQPRMRSSFASSSEARALRSTHRNPSASAARVRFSASAAPKTFILPPSDEGAHALGWLTPLQDRNLIAEAIGWPFR